MYKIVKLCKIATVSTGFPFKGEFYTHEGTRVVRGENVTVGSLRWDTVKCWNREFEQADKYSLKDGDVVIGMDGSRVGRNRARIKDDDLPLLLAQRVALIRNNELSNQNFLYYLIKSNLFEEYVDKIQTGSAVPHISQKQIQEFPVPLIPIDTQKNISDILLILDKKIELNNRINAKLEAMAKTFYDYWFVQFDFPDANGKPYRSSGGKMEWNEELKRTIPEGWEVGTLVDIADLVRGVTYNSSEIKKPDDPNVIPILRATNISGNVIDLNDMVYVPKQRVSATQILNKFDILITMSSGSIEHIGKNGFYYYEKEVSFGAFCAKIVAKEDYKYYLYSYTQSDFMFTTIKNECLGTNINNLNGSLVKNFRTIIPNKELIKSFNTKVNTVYELIGNNLIENQKLTEIRDWLLPMLMNGQVQVKSETKEQYSMAAEPQEKYGK